MRLIANKRAYELVTGGRPTTLLVLKQQSLPTVEAALTNVSTRA